MSQDAKPPSPRQVLLGWFIVAQLLYLLGSNVLGFVRYFPTENRQKPNELINRAMPRFAEKQGNAWPWTEQAENVMNRWSEVTGQDQAWSLFAPTISKGTGFPAVLLSWDDPYADEQTFPGTTLSYHAKNGFNLCADWTHPPEAREPSLAMASGLGLLMAQHPWEALALCEAIRARSIEKKPHVELLLSDNEPPDLHAYLRLGNCRVRKFEGNFYINPQPYALEDADPLATRLTTRMREFATDYHDLAAAYLRWRLKSWQDAHPDSPAPTQVILLERFYRIHGPKEEPGWDGPYTVPMARWLPSPKARPGFYTLEQFDFTEQRFVPMTRYR